MDGGASPHHDSGSAEHRPTGPVAPQQRQWAHPSEVGLCAREQTDRRRSRILVVGLVAIGTGVLMATATLATGWGRDTRDPVVANPVPAPDRTLVIVESADEPGRDPLTGVVVDGGRHVLVSGADLDGAEDMTVRVGDRTSAASLSATDHMSGLVLLRLEGRTGNTPEMGASPELGPQPTVGGSLRLLHFGSDDRIHSHQLTVKSIDAELVRPDDSLATGLLALAGPSELPGPLMDADGRLEGWVVGTDGERALAYSADSLMLIVTDLLEHGQVDRGWIGVRAAAAEPGGSGALVIDVHEETPAAAAGIIAGDLVVAVEDEPVEDLKDLVSALDHSGPGAVVRVALLRDGQAHTLSVTVGEHPAGVAAQSQG